MHLSLSFLLRFFTYFISLLLFQRQEKKFDGLFVSSTDSGVGGHTLSILFTVIFKFSVR